MKTSPSGTVSFVLSKKQYPDLLETEKAVLSNGFLGEIIKLYA